MLVRQTRVFVRSDEPANDWWQTLIGKVFRPLTGEFRDYLEWFWFSRYACEEQVDSGDCDISAIPNEYKQPLQPGGSRFHRSMRFRFNIADQAQFASFARRANELISQGGYCISDFREYDFVADTGSNRFLGVENREPETRRHQRAALTTEFYQSTSKLVLDTLVGPDENGRFRLERNDDPQNPRESTFQSLLHLFCNITDVPTDVLVYSKANPNLMVLSTIYEQVGTPPGGWDNVTAYPIRY